MADEKTQQAIWNFDGAELYTIFGIKLKFIECLDNWLLEDAYWALRSLRREIDAKLRRQEKKIIQEFEQEKSKTKKPKKTEKKEVDDMMEGLDKKRKEYNNEVNPPDEKKADFYLELEKCYMKICFIMKKHGLYFREGEDSRLAVLRR
jgi:hypothetical protein